MGAGVIPFSVLRGQVCFLFQKTFTGRKAGHLVDFGGGGGAGESYAQTALREFIEETETMYFSPDIRTAARTPAQVESQLPLVERLFETTLREHPDWWCRRAAGVKQPPKDWRTFFIEFEYQDVSGMNREWQNDNAARFKKRRELVWIASDELLAIYRHTPERLWKRVRELIDAETTIQSIQQHKEAG